MTYWGDARVNGPDSVEVSLRSLTAVQACRVFGLLAEFDGEAVES